MIAISLHWQKRRRGDKGYLIIRGLSDKPIWEPIGLTLTGRPSIDKEIKLSAEKIKAKRLIEIVEKGYDIPPTLSNRDFLKYYKKVIDERPEYERRASVYKHLCNFTKGNRLTFRDINESFWEKFRKYLAEEKNHSQYTIHTVLSIIKAVLNRAVRDRIIFRNPLQDVKEKRPSSDRTYLTLEELKQLDKTPCPDNEIKRAFFFSCYTGLRRSDMLALKKKDIVNDEIILKKMQKTKEPLRVPIGTTAKKYMGDISGLNDDDFIFSKLPAWSTVSIIIKNWVKLAGINKKITYHSSRHTFATLILTYGGSLETVRDLLGHGDIRETQIYAKIIDKKKEEAIKRLPDL